MKILNTILAEEIRRGKVTVDVPGLDMDWLKEFLHSEVAQTLDEIAAIACAEEMTAEEKIGVIQEKLS